ncbi:MAG: 5-(carboxyamino)imidazole ribonucleotide mutase [Bacillota bacterium]
MPRVGIVMGSDSDIPVMRRAGEVLEQLNISYEARVLSAHRTPEETAEWARSARDRGIEVLIAGAGGSAALPGVVAAHTTLPVIGVPLKAWATDGLDALLAVSQMPKGIPVACVAINGAQNAGLLAAAILGVADDGVTDALREYRGRRADEVAAKDRALVEGGLTGGDTR